MRGWTSLTITPGGTTRTACFRGRTKAATAWGYVPFTACPAQTASQSLHMQSMLLEGLDEDLTEEDIWEFEETTFPATGFRPGPVPSARCTSSWPW